MRTIRWSWIAAALAATFLFSSSLRAQCPMGTVAAPTDFHANDTVMIEDAFPTPHTLAAPGVVWDTAQRASGAASFVHPNPPSSATQEIFVYNLANQRVNAGDVLVTYVLIDTCNPTQEILISYGVQGLGTRRVYWGAAELLGVAATPMGSLPAAGAWARLEVPAAILGSDVVGRNINSIAWDHVGGRVWYDRVGKKNPYNCSAVAAAPANFHANDVVFWDDTFPAGATIHGTYAWDSVQKASGTQSFSRQSGTTGGYEVYVQGFPTVRVEPNDELVTYVRIDPCNPPSQIYLLYATSRGYKVPYWGTNVAGASGPNMGPLTAQMLSGDWVRLSVHEDLVPDLEGATFSGISFGVVDGKAWFDRPGKKTQYNCNAVAAAPTNFHPYDIVLWDDAFPAGTTVQGAYAWDSVQKASGTQSFSRESGATGGYEVYVQGFPAVRVEANDELVTYVRIDPCRPPKQLYILYVTNRGYKTPYWGPNIAGASGPNMGPLTPEMLSGEWVRIALHEDLLGNLEGATFGGISFGVVDGKAWFDRPGKKTPVDCNAAAAPTSFDPNEQPLWDDAFPAGSSAVAPPVWRTEFKVSGTQSLLNDRVNGPQTDLGVTGLTAREVREGEQIVLYVRADPCTTLPQQIYVAALINNQYKFAYWGPNVVGVNGVQISATLPAGLASGDWVRLVMPEDTWSDAQGKMLTGIYFGIDRGRVWWDRAAVVVVPCTIGTPTASGLLPSDGVWFDDSFPAPGVVDAPGVTWDSTQKASGASSFRHPNPDVNGSNQVFVHEYVAQPFTVNAADKLLFYMLVDPCEPPDQIIVTWTPYRSTYKHASWGATVITTPDPQRNMGAIPTPGIWHRIEIPASDLGLGGSQVTGLAVNGYGGKVWFDRVGRVCPAPSPAAAGADATETIWIDDAPPAGASSTGNGTFVSAYAASGSQSLAMGGYGTFTHEFTGATTTLTPAAGEALVTYALFNECNRPKELVLSWRTTAGEWKRAYWGVDTLYGNGRNSSIGFYRMGDVPSGNVWHRMAVNAARLGLEGVTIDSFKIEMIDGQGWFDRIGKSTTPMCATSYPQPDPELFWDEVLISGDDTPPTGATVSANWTWDTAEKASGTASHTDGFHLGPHQHSFTGASVPFVTGDWLSVWVLIDVCDGAREILIGANGKYLYFGENLIPVGPGETKKHWPWDPFPQRGVWTRLWLPASEFGLEGTNLTNFTFAAYDGQVWFDRFAKIPAWADVTSITLDKAPTISVGQSITATVTATGSFHPIEYQYWIRNTTTGQWTMVQDWTTSNTFTWTPSASQTGSWWIWAGARNAGSRWDWEDYEVADVTVTP